ncbi:MAG: adenylate/guanylate cyclase domain-containing protein [Anaerolineales bacterium]
MWRLHISESDAEARWVELSAGKTVIGRSADSQVILADVSTSRHHAELTLDASQKKLSLRDLESVNGTYVNRQRINGLVELRPNDVIRIGQAVLYIAEENSAAPQAKTTHRFTRELLLESLDEHAILLYEVARKLNTITDLPSAVQELTLLIKRALGVDEFELFLPSAWNPTPPPDLDTAALAAIRNQSAEVFPTLMYVPIISGEEVLGLMRLAKTSPGARPFGRHDLQLAIAISHQTALTLQRVELLRKLRQEERIHQLLHRFVPPAEAEYLIKDYLRSGALPGLRQDKITILFSDMEGSTALAEQIGVLRFSEIINRYYHEATTIVFQHGGMVRYLGDGIMAIFEDRHQNYEHALAEERAVRAGREIVEKIRTLDFGAGQRITIGVAVNTGVCMVGYIGSEERMEFNALGDPVNVAFRMQELARPYRLVVGPATMAAIVDKYQTHRIGAVSLRGREKPVQVYEVLQPL